MVIDNDLYVPLPADVGGRLVEMCGTVPFWRSVSVSLFRVLSGLLLAVALGVLLGALSCAHRLVRAVVEPFVSITRATPAASFIVLVLLWLTSSAVPVFICFLMCFPVIWTGVVQGAEHTDARLLEMAKLNEVGLILVLRRIYVPSAMPFFLSSCASCLGLGWKAGIAAEVLSFPRYGIGADIWNAKASLDTEGLFAWTVTAVAASMAFEFLFVRLARSLPGSNTTRNAA